MRSLTPCLLIAWVLGFASAVLSNPAPPFLHQWGALGSTTDRFRSLANVTTAGHDIYALDAGAQEIQVFTVDGDFVARAVVDVSLGLVSLKGVAVAGDGTYYVTDARAHRVLHLNAHGLLIRSWGEYGQENGQFWNPRGVTVHEGMVVVADQYNRRVQVFDTEGGFVRGWDLSAFGVAPIAVLVQDNGAVLVLSEGSVVELGQAGVQNRWGSPGQDPGQLSLAADLAVDGDGNVYVADMANHRIQKFSPQGVLLCSWGALGSDGGEFNFPTGVAVAADGSIVVADRDNGRLQVFGGKVPAEATSWGRLKTGF